MMQDQIAAAILWLCTVWSPCPRCEMAVDSEARNELARIILDANIAHGVDPWLVTAMTFFESSFSSGAEGTRGEHGLLQLMPGILAECEKDDIDTQTPAGQMWCGSRHLKRQLDRCGSVSRGISSFGTGGDCSKSTDKWVQIRIWLAAKLRKNFGE